MNPENLTEIEIKNKIEYLQKQIHKTILSSGEVYCKNRIKRVKTLKSYLTKNI